MTTAPFTESSTSDFNSYSNGFKKNLDRLLLYEMRKPDVTLDTLEKDVFILFARLFMRRVYNHVGKMSKTHKFTLGMKVRDLACELFKEAFLLNVGKGDIASIRRVILELITHYRIINEFKMIKEDEYVYCTSSLVLLDNYCIGVI